MEWQPIETAPKDGTCVDLWDEDLQMRCTDCNFRHMTDGEYWAADKPLKGKYWFDGFGIRVRATHWMPLPNPPQHEESKL